MRRNPKIVSLTPPAEAAAGISPNRLNMDHVKEALLSAPQFLASVGLTAADVNNMWDAFGKWKSTMPESLPPGHYARAFLLSSGLVLKVTDDKDDAEAAAVIQDALERGELPEGIIYIKEVKVFRDKYPSETDAFATGEKKPVYVIVSERVEPVIGFAKDWRDAMRPLGPTGDQMSLKGFLAALTIRKIWSVKDATSVRGFVRGGSEPNVIEAVAKQALAALPKERLKQLDQVLKGLKWMSSKGFVVTDVHEGNFGTAAGDRTVLFDFGHGSKTEEAEKNIPAIYLAKNALPIDNDVETGIGAVGYNQDVDYFGLRVLMRPSVFHKLTTELPREDARSADWMKKQIQAGRRFGAPILYLDIPPEWDDGDLTKPAIVSGHEGRNRMYASKELYGDDDLVEVHLLPKGLRNRHLTSEWIERIKQGLVSERHRRQSTPETRGPLFSKVLNAQSGRSSGWRSGVTPNSRASMPKTRAAFDECFDVLVEQFSDFGDLELHQDEMAGSDNGHGAERQFGYCMDSEPIRIAFAAKTEQLPVANIRGLMAHEFGHALDHRYGDKLGKLLGQRLPDGAERRADAIAKAVFGKTIKYDARDIQCVACRGTSPRPRRLGP